MNYRHPLICDFYSRFFLAKRDKLRLAPVEVLQEIHSVVECGNVLRILKRGAREPSSIMATIVSLCSLVEAKSTVEAIQDDPADNLVLACAMDARGDFIISEDRRLLKLGEYENVKILNATSLRVSSS